MTDNVSRLKMLRTTVIDDACNVSGLLDDIAIKALTERTLAEAKGKRQKGAAPGRMALEGHVEQVESIRAAKEAAIILGLLSEKGVNATELKTTYQVLFSALAKGFVHADNEETRTHIAEAMRAVKAHGLEKEWGDALRLGLDKYFNSDTLGEFVAKSNEKSNKTAISKALQRRASIAEIGGSGMPRLLFEARCGHALGRNDNTLRLVEAGVIAYIERMSQLAEWSFQIAISIVHLDNRKAEILHPNTIKITGDLNRYGSTRDLQVLMRENLDENERRLREAWDKLKKPKNSECSIRLVVNGVALDVELF